jgi:selenocysteine lyase/cysteine desulfurase
LVRGFKKEGVVINQRAGRLRISPHFYNTHAEIDRLIDLLQRGGVALATGFIKEN